MIAGAPEAPGCYSTQTNQAAIHINGFRFCSKERRLARREESGVPKRFLLPPNIEST